MAENEEELPNGNAALDTDQVSADRLPQRYDDWGIRDRLESSGAGASCGRCEVDPR